MLNVFRVASILLSIVVLVGGVGASKRLVPPTYSLLGAQNNIVVATAIELTDDGVVFDRIVDLHGETAERVTVRVGESVRDGIALGERYIVAHSNLFRDRSSRSKDYFIDPKGPRVVLLPVVESALFNDTKTLRALVEIGVREGVERRRMDLLMQQLVVEDTRARRLVLAEILLRPGQAAVMNEADIAVLRGVMEAGDPDPIVTELAVRVMAPLAESGEQTWLADVIRPLIKGYDRELDLSSPVPAMLITALEAFGATGEAADTDVLVEHIYSNNPGVGKAAFEAIYRLDPQGAVEVASTAVASSAIHPDVSRAIDQALSAAESDG